MIDRDSPVTADELHAYVDGELPRERLQAVEDWLASHPDDAARVAEWRAISDAVRARYGDVINEPSPPQLDLERLDRAERSWRTVAAAALIAGVIGAAGGWITHGATRPAPTASDLLTTEALAAHKLYINEVRHPIEVRAGESHLVPWLSKRVGAAHLRAPNLESHSLKLLGGRLLPGPIGPAAMFMYEGASGERFTFYCTKSAATRSGLRYQVGGEIAAIYWVESELAFVVSGPADRDHLAEIARTAYDQLESPPTRASALPVVFKKGS